MFFSIIYPILSNQLDRSERNIFQCYNNVQKQLCVKYDSMFVELLRYSKLQLHLNVICIGTFSQFMSFFIKNDGLVLSKSLLKGFYSSQVQTSRLYYKWSGFLYKNRQPGINRHCSRDISTWDTPLDDSESLY